MRYLLAALALAACGGTPTSPLCSAPPAGNFTFHATLIGRDSDALCAALPTTFDVSLSVTSVGVTGTENGQTFSTQPQSPYDCG